MWIGHRKEIQKLAFWALALRLSPTEGLTLKTSALESFYGHQFTLSTELIKTIIVLYSPPMQHHSFLIRNVPLYTAIWDWWTPVWS